MDLDRARSAVLVALAVLAGLVCQLLLGTSYVAATLDPLREEGGIPVGIVLLDGGEHGARLASELEARESVVLWTRLPDRAAMTRALEEKELYGALVIPADFSARLESFASDAPRAAEVETYTNPGASTSGSIVAGRALELAVDAARARVREEALASAQVASTGLGALTIAQGRFLAEPIEARAIEVNAVPERGANGLAPTYFAMAAWIGGYLGALALERFRARTQLGPLPRAGIMLGAALAQGALATASAAAVGFHVRDPAQLALLLALATWMAYALVALLTDLLGLAAVLPAFAILALGLPASGALYPEGVLPGLYRWIHDVSPFTWIVEGSRSILYAPGATDTAGHMLALAVLAAACSALSIGLGVLRRRGMTSSAS